MDTHWINNKSHTSFYNFCIAFIFILIKWEAVLKTSTTATAGDLSAQAYAGLGVQEQYVFNVLAKNFKGSSKVGAKEFKSFAQQFVTAYDGQLNLLDNYSGINGEYQLVRQFVKSSS